ncbi:MAG: hypothetical protein BZ135_01030 [Methanosphaera sp. rholeuAM6]|nr:MAG: hypothetical protein BZ135_01030 [Methanosphaera sp. rholeuAM6]
MQQCLHCGQLNDDNEDYCVYCGEAMYIQIEHDNDVKMDHLYADSIARELIKENTTFEDDLDEITRELLGETEPKQETFIINGEEYTFNNTQDLDDLKDEKLIELEQKLKTKLRRNKKLEAGMGLLLRNIDIILDDYEGPLIIMGEITTNDKLDNKSVQLSAISYDENKTSISKTETIINVDHGNFVNFTITLDLDIEKTDMIIILPEKIQYDDDTTPEIAKEKKHYTQTPKHTEANSIFIEQLSDIERKIGMQISNTSVIIKSDNEIEIVGEIRIENPDKYHDIKIAATCYNEENTIIATESTLINTQLFLGFDTLSLKIHDVNVSDIQRIKLYPTLQ